MTIQTSPARYAHFLLSITAKHAPITHTESQFINDLPTEVEVIDQPATFRIRPLTFTGGPLNTTQHTCNMLEIQREDGEWVCAGRELLPNTPNTTYLIERITDAELAALLAAVPEGGAPTLSGE